MKFTLAWLEEHLATDQPLDAIVDRLTMIGLEVESVADRAKVLAPFSIARVISAEPHPNADRLRVCMVDTGGGDPVQVVCGAPNARAGMKGVFVPPGAFIPGKGITLGIGSIRGVESRGMLVSELELQLSDDHEGIIDLPADAPVGASYAQWAGLDDPVIEIALTPNRADCAAVAGIARDLAAAGVGRLEPAAIGPVEGRFPCPVAVTLDFGATPRHGLDHVLCMLRLRTGTDHAERLVGMLRAAGFEAAETGPTGHRGLAVVRGRKPAVPGSG